MLQYFSSLYSLSPFPTCHLLTYPVIYSLCTLSVLLTSGEAKAGALPILLTAVSCPTPSPPEPGTAPSTQEGHHEYLLNDEVANLGFSVTFGGCGNHHMLVWVAWLLVDRPPSPYPHLQHPQIRSETSEVKHRKGSTSLPRCYMI